MATIAINTVFLNPDRVGGGETYVRKLIEHLQRIESPHRFLILTGGPTDVRLDHPRFRAVECGIGPRRPKRRILYEELRLPRVLRELRPDLVHFPYGSAPRGYRGRSVTTIHDTLRFHFPEQIPWLERAYKAYVESNLRRRRSHIICVSQADAADLRRHVDVREEDVSVVYHGVSERFIEAGRRFGAGDKQGYGLWVGRPYPRKNVPVLIRAWALLKARRPDVPTLRIVGPTLAEARPLEELARQEALGGLVSVERAVPHTDLPEMMARAMLFCYPSLYESFGLLVLEAMASSTATVCSDLPVFRELHGDAVAYARAESPEAFAKAVERLLDDAAARRELEKRGQAHAAAFTWDACVERTLRVYERLLG